MKTEVTGSFQRFMGKKITKMVIAGGLIAVTIGALFQFNVINLKSTAEAIVEQRTAVVKRGDLSLKVTGSGPIVSSNREELTPYVNGTITKVYFKEGDTVKEGDLMFELDDADAVLNVEKIQNSIKQTELTLNSNVESMSKLSIAAPFNGQVTNITVKKGDEINKNATVLTITDKSKLQLSVPFNGSSINEIKLGQKATVNIQSLMHSIEGTVTFVSDTAYTTSSGGKLYTVEVEVKNPGSLEEGMKGNVEINTSKGLVSSTDNGTLTYVNSMILKTETGGTVKKVNVKENQCVDNGYILLELEDDNLIIAKETTDLKIQDLQAQLNSAQKQLSNCKIYAPISGTIVSQDIKAGKVVKSGEVISTVADNNLMEMTVSIDELDIAKIQVGMEVSITVDALAETSGKPINGKVSRIAIEGTSSNGVTTYPVTISFNGSDSIKGGMNANAEIYVSNKNNVLYVPIEAVQKMRDRALVMVKTDNSEGAENDRANGLGNETNTGKNSRTERNGANNTRGGAGNQAGGTNGAMPNMMAGGRSQNSSYYVNAVPRMVEVGINNETYIEIISGLNEGDEVILPPVTGSQNQTGIPRNGTFPAGGMGGMIGGGNRSGMGGMGR